MQPCCKYTVVLVLLVIGSSRERRVQRELARLRIMVGEFSETDIDTVFRHAISFEKLGNYEKAVELLHLVADNSTDSENVRLARELLDRIAAAKAQM